MLALLVFKVCIFMANESFAQQSISMGFGSIGPTWSSFAQESSLNRVCLSQATVERERQSEDAVKGCNLIFSGEFGPRLCHVDSFSGQCIDIA